MGAGMKYLKSLNFTVCFSARGHNHASKVAWNLLRTSLNYPSALSRPILPEAGVFSPLPSEQLSPLHDSAADYERLSA
jgi:hypothetical protein